MIKTEKTKIINDKALLKCLDNMDKLLSKYKKETVESKLMDSVFNKDKGINVLFK